MLISKAWASQYATHADINDVFIRKAYHKSDTHLTSTFNGKLYELWWDAKLPRTAKKLFAHMSVAWQQLPMIVQTNNN